METLNKLAYNILNKLEGGRSTTNSFISLDQIKYNIEHYRALFLRRELRNDEDLHPFEQKIQLTFSRKTESNPPFIVNNYLVSNEELPNIIRLKDRYALRVFNKQRTKVIPVQNAYISHLQDYNRYTRKDARAYILDNKLHITSDSISYLVDQSIKDKEYDLTEKDAIFYNINNIFIVGVFDSPTDVFLRNGYSPVDVDDKPYPLSMDMSARITEGILNGTLPLIKQTTADITHNNLPNQ